MNLKLTFRHAALVIGLMVTASLPMTTSTLAEIFKGYPDAIICRTLDARAVVYIAQVKDDGSAVYRALEADIFATVTPDHVFHRAGAKDCDGKTLDQLRQDGQTRQTQ